MHKLVNMTNGYFTEADLDYARNQAGILVNRSIRDDAPITYTAALRSQQADWRYIVEMPVGVLAAHVNERRIARRLVAAYACLAREHEENRRRIVEDRSDSILALGPDARSMRD